MKLDSIRKPKPNGRLDLLIASRTQPTMGGKPLIPNAEPNMIRYALKKLHPALKPILSKLFFEQDSTFQTYSSGRTATFPILNVYVKDSDLYTLLRINGYPYQDVGKLVDAIFYTIRGLFRGFVSNYKIDTTANDENRIRITFEEGVDLDDFKNETKRS